MIEPKKQTLADRKLQRKRCDNPNCQHWLPAHKVKVGAKYCDHMCHNEHQKIQGLERRPAEILCAYCDTPIDTEKRKPSDLERAERYFCNGICADAYRRVNNQYKVMQKKGGVAIKMFKEKHGKVHSYKNRKEKVSENNIKAPPKNKNFDRQGKAWGYDVNFKGTGNDYIVSVPELPEIEAFHAPTKKAGLLAVRAKMIEMRNSDSD